MKLPLAENKNIIEQSNDKELLIYDITTNKAYVLNETSRIVYQACDGETTFEDLTNKHKLTDDLIFLTLDELKRNNLLADIYQSPFKRISRREAVRKVGLSTMFALPIISSLIVPQSSAAASACVPSNGACYFTDGSQSNCCNANQRCGPQFGGGEPYACSNCLPNNLQLACDVGSSAGCCSAFAPYCCTSNISETYMANDDYYACRCSP